MRLSNYSIGDYTPGASLPVRALWHFIGSPLLQSRLIPFSSFKIFVLSLFGTQIGKGVVIKCGVRVKHPWRLKVGDNSWIGEDVWIDNVAPIRIGCNCCISQGAYLCSGDHDYKSPTFDLRLREINIGDRVWIAGQSRVAPGCTIEDGSVLGFASVARGTLPANGIYAGNPARLERKRKFGATRPSARESILFINQSYYPDKTATAQHLAEISSDLATKGHDVSVLCSRRCYIDNNVTRDTVTSYNDVKIKRVDSIILPGSSRAIRLVNALLMNVAFLWKLMFIKQYDTVVVMTSPPLIGWVARFFMRRPKKKFIYWVMDLNPDQIISAGWIRENSLSAKLLNICLKSVLNYADRVIVLDERMKDRLKGRIDNQEKLCVLPLWISTSSLQSVPHDSNEFRSDHGLRDKFVVMYSGNLSLCHPMETLLLTAEKMKKDPSTVFLVVGGGHGLKEINRFKCDRELDNLICLPYQERTNLSSSLSAADVHIVSLGDQFDGIIHPSKIYGILGVERPFVLLGPEDCFMDQQFVKAGLGERVNHGDSDALESALTAYRLNGQRPESKENLAQVKAELDSRKIFERFEDILNYRN